MKQNELKDSYIYTVVRHVPKAQREDIKLELESLIDDMCESRNNTVEQVLAELGDPVEFAKQYADNNTYLIGPSYFDNFLWVTKIVLLCTLLSALASALFQAISTTSLDQLASVSFWNHSIQIFFREFFTNAITSSLVAFGLVTLVFAILERSNVSINRKQPSTWSPKKLSPIPDSKYVISRGDCIASMIFCTLFSALLIYSPQIFGAFHYENGSVLQNVPVFNLDQWDSLLPMFLFIFSLGLIDAIIQLFVGVYSRLVLISTVTISLIQFILTIILFKTMDVFNPNFSTSLSKVFEHDFTSNSDLLSYWNTALASNIVILIATFATCLEIGITVYKCIQYKRRYVLD